MNTEFLLQNRMNCLRKMVLSHRVKSVTWHFYLIFIIQISTRLLTVLTASVIFDLEQENNKQALSIYL